MLHLASDLIGRRLQAKDGEIGEIRDYFFDDKYWRLSYLVVETSSWGDDRQVLIAPECFLSIDWNSNGLPANLTREQVRNSPDVDTNPPLSRQHLAQLIQYWGWPSREFPDLMYTKSITGAESDERQVAVMDKETDPYLHSWREVMGYSLVGPDGLVATVKDLVVDDLCWALRYLLVKTGGLLHAHQTLLQSEWVERIVWGKAEVRVSAARAAVETGPEYDASRPLDRAYEEKLCEHYGLPRYWEKKRARE